MIAAYIMVTGHNQCLCNCYSCSYVLKIRIIIQNSLCKIPATVQIARGAYTAGSTHSKLYFDDIFPDKIKRVD